MRPIPPRQLVPLPAVLVIAAVALAGCSPGSAASAVPASPFQPAPSGSTSPVAPSVVPPPPASADLACRANVPWLGHLEGAQLEPGTYASLRFRPCFTLRFGDANWQVVEGNAPNLVILALGEGDPGPLPFLNFVAPSQIYDPSDLTTLLPIPDDLTGWLRSHPSITAGPSQSVTVGGVPGAAFDISVSSLPEELPNSCFGDPCVPLFAIKQGASPPYALAPDVRERLIVLEVGGSPLLIGLSTLPADFDAFLPVATAELVTLEFID